MVVYQSRSILQEKVSKFICDKASNVMQVEVEKNNQIEIGFFNQQLKRILQIQKQMLNSNQKHHIPSPSTILTNNQQFSQCKKTFSLQYFKDILKNASIFEAFEVTSIKIILWDILLLVIHCILIFSLCLSISFQSKLTHLIYNKIIFAGLLMFLSLDILMRFNRSYFEQGIVIKNHKQIGKRYLKRITFFIDFIGVLSLIPTLHRDTAFQFFFFLKGIHIVNLTNCLENRISLIIKQGRNLFLKIVKFSIIFISVIHIFTCAILMADKFDKDHNIFEKQQILMDQEAKNGSNSLNINDPNEKYLHSLLFVITTIIPIGFGEITAQNKFEKITTIVIIFVGIGILINFIMTINIVSQYIIKQHSQQNSNLQTIINFMQIKNVNLRTRYAVQSYLKYRWTQFSPRNIFLEQSVLNILSPTLHKQILFESYQDFIKNSHFLSNLFSPSFLYQLPSIIQELRVDPGETLFKDNLMNLNDNNLYIIQEGEIAVNYQCDCSFSIESAKNCNCQNMSQDKNMFITKTLKKGEILGFSLFFFPNSGRVMRAKATSYTQLLFINYNQFLNLIQQFPDDYERYCYVRDEVTFNYNYGIIGQSCYFCGNSDHLVRNCTQIHLELNVQEKKNLFKNESYQLYRVQQNRKRKLKSNRLLQNEEEMLKFAKFKMVQQKSLNEYKNIFNLNTQSSMSDQEDSFYPANQGLKKAETTYSKKNIQNLTKTKSIEKQTSIKTSNQYTQNSQQQQQLQKQVSITTSQSKQETVNSPLSKFQIKQTQSFQNTQQQQQQLINNNINTFSNANSICSNQLIPQQQYQQDQKSIDIDDNNEVLHPYQNKSHQDTSRKEIYQSSSMADSMILELKPSSYINLFERGKLELEQKTILQQKLAKANIAKYPPRQRSSLQNQIQQQQQQQQTQLPGNHLGTLNHPVIDIKRNSNVQESRMSLDSNVMKFLLPTNKFNENGTQNIDHIAQEGIRLGSKIVQNPLLYTSSRDILPFFTENSMSKFLASNESNPYFKEISYQQNQREGNERISENYAKKKKSLVKSKTKSIKHSIHSNLLNDCSVTDFEFYYPHWNHEFIISFINANYHQFDQDITHPLQFIQKSPFYSIYNQQSFLIQSFIQHSVNKQKNPIILKKIRNSQREQTLQSQNNYNLQDISQIPLKSNFGNQSFNIETNYPSNISKNYNNQIKHLDKNTNQCLNPLQDLQQMTLGINHYQEDSPLYKQQQKISKKQYRNTRQHSKSTSNSAQTHLTTDQNFMKKPPTESKIRNHDFKGDILQAEVSKENDKIVDLNHQHSLEIYSHHTIQGKQKSRDQMRFVESLYSLNKGFTSLGKDKRKSEIINILANGFLTKNKTTEFNYNNDSQIEENHFTEENNRSETENQYNLVYSHYNSTKNENINDSEQTVRPEVSIKNFYFPSKEQFQQSI